MRNGFEKIKNDTQILRSECLLLSFFFYCKSIWRRQNRRKIDEIRKSLISYFLTSDTQPNFLISTFCSLRIIEISATLYFWQKVGHSFKNYWFLEECSQLLVSTDKWNKFFFFDHFYIKSFELNIPNSIAERKVIFCNFSFFRKKKTAFTIILKKNNKKKFPFKSLLLFRNISNTLLFKIWLFKVFFNTFRAVISFLKFSDLKKAKCYK